MSAYWDYIEEQKGLLQMGELEVHHIKSRKNYPNLASDPANLLILSIENHDYATLLQCEEENFPFLDPWRGKRLLKTHPELKEKVEYWLLRRSKYANSCSVHARRDRGEIQEWVDRMAEIHRQRDYPPAAWYWRVNPETGETETKLWAVPEGEGWQKGRPENTWNKGKPSYKRRRVKCTVTGHEGTQSSLARWQKNRGIDPANREFID